MKRNFTLLPVKQKLLFIVFAALFTITANATVHTVQVANFSFTPDTVNAVVGDTILWQWVSGTHTTTSLSEPTGAASWSSPMTSSVQTFQYKLTVAGTYSYECLMHPSQMTGTLTVTNAASVTEVANDVAVTIYPNPSAGRFEIATTKPIERLAVTDITGKTVLDREINADHAVFDLSNEAEGVYLMRLLANGAVITKRIIISK